MKRTIVLILRNIYRYLPLSLKTKRKIKNKLLKKSNLVRRINSYNINNFKYSSSLGSKEIPLDYSQQLSTINKKIAVHLHLYYVDLTDEFVMYLNNIPYSFDLYLSVVDGADLNKVREDFSKVKHVNNLIIEVCQNVGRDFSPMIVQFGKRLLKYDYLLHLHTKKSFRTGEEQSGWRRHLVESLLKDESTVKNIFYHFERNATIGMIYPETYWDMPYWAHTYLKNFSKCSELASKFGIKIEDEYIDYSVGSMFWVKVNSIKKLFMLGLTYKDFGKEEGKADGTLAHAIERIFPLLVRQSGMKYLVLDLQNNMYRETGVKNLYQYASQTKESVLACLSEFDTITFDIFDTLITRCVYNPDDIKKLLDVEIRSRLSLSDDFINIRNIAEFNVRSTKNFQGDCTIDEIYAEIKKILNLSDDDVKYIKNLEEQYEIDYCIPRRDMLEIYNELLSRGKKIVLISDMYLSSDVVAKMLSKCGYSNWSKLIISCEVGCRKDNGTMWDYYYSNNSENSIHVGDNEQSDIQANCDLGKNYLHVMQGKKMFLLSHYGKFIRDKMENTFELGDSCCLGLIINNEIFNSPFSLDKISLHSDFKSIGYSIFGPMFFKYFIWLNKKITENKNDLILFLAREGYYFQKLYLDYCEFSGIKPLKNEYFLTSRRSVSVAAIENDDDILLLLERQYEGGLKNLLSSRFGIEDNDLDDTDILLPRDKNKVFKIINSRKKSFLAEVKKEHDNYLKYANKKIKNFKNIAVVDLGYSGTIQFYLSKLLKRSITGYYFTLSDKVIADDCNCCFDSQNGEESEKYILYFSMILESFLTAPYGQLKRFDKSGKPVYLENRLSGDDLAKLDDIYEGIRKFMHDYIELNKNTIDDVCISNKFIASNFSSLIFVDKSVDSEIESFFKLEDKYCSDDVLNVFEYLRKEFLEKDSEDGD